MGEWDVEDVDWDESPRRSRRGPLIAFGSAGLLLVAALVWALVSFGVGGSDRVSAAATTSASPSTTTRTSTTTAAAIPVAPVVATGETAVAFLTAWHESDYVGMQALVADQADDVVGAYEGLAQRLGVTDVTVVPGVFDATTSSLPFQVTLTLQDLGTVEWSSVVKVGPDARVAWTAPTLYPELVPGQWLDLVAAPSRAELVDVSGQPLSGDADLAANLVGEVDPATGVGVNGLQRALETQLAGASGSRIVVADALTGAVVMTVKEFPGSAAPPPVSTTIDLRVQAAAEAALTAAPGRSALVALDMSTGGVLAVANSPVSGLPVALSGAYPPGSTFKIVTASALVRAGLSQDSAVDCPQTLFAGGRTWSNSSGVSAGSLTLGSAFAVSCNTAFIDQASRLPTNALADAAASFGFGTSQPLPVGSASGAFPAPSGTFDADAAAAAIGQGQVTASPLHMASVAAAVGAGVWRQPHVVDCSDCASRRVGDTSALQSMMRAVVTSGTGTAVAGVPGGPVYGKTGSAEASSGTHAWFVGWQGSTAFAVFVENGGSGGRVAAPVAAAFLTALGGG